MLLGQNIERGWRRIGVLPLEQADGAGVLLTSKDELLLFSRCSICLQTGMATVSMMAMMVIAVRSTAIAYPASPAGRAEELKLERSDVC